MLVQGRIPLSAAEGTAVDRLLAAHGHGSLTRRDPGESGPVLVECGRDRKVRRFLVDEHDQVEEL